MNQRGASEISAILNARSARFSRWSSKSIRRPLSESSTRLELLDGPAHARTDGAGRHRGRDSDPNRDRERRRRVGSAAAEVQALPPRREPVVRSPLR